MNEKIVALTATGIVIAGVGLGVYIKNTNELMNGMNTKVNTLTEKVDSQNKTIDKQKNTIEGLQTDLKVMEQEKKGVVEQIEKLEKENKSLKDENYYPTQNVAFNASDITQPSGVDIKRLNKVLEGTGLSGLAKHYIQAEYKYGINALALVALTAQESGWGESSRAMNTNNLSGYAVYSPASAGRSFSTKGESILATAKLLSTDYTSTTSKHDTGRDLYSINKVYCPDDGGFWSSNIIRIANNLKTDINNL